MSPYNAKLDVKNIKQIEPLQQDREIKSVTSMSGHRDISGPKPLRVRHGNRRGSCSATDQN